MTDRDMEHEKRIATTQRRDVVSTITSILAGASAVLGLLRHNYDAASFSVLLMILLVLLNIAATLRKDR